MYQTHNVRFSEQQHSAKITQELREVRVKEGMKAKFEASFAGNPKPDIIWQFNGVEIESTDRVKVIFYISKYPY